MEQNSIKCTLCKSRKVISIDTKIRNIEDDSSKMYRCEECGTHFLYPQPDQLETYYDGNFREEEHDDSYYEECELDKQFQSFTPEAKIRVARVERELKPEDDILEIGCSVGYFLKAAADKVHMAYGTEWDSCARAYVNQYIKDDRIKALKNPEDFSLKFDKIFMFHVLEHIADPIAFLSHLKLILKRGGKIYIEVPNADDILVKTYQCQKFMDLYYKKAHLYNFNETGLKYVFEHSGFSYKIQYIQRYDISNHFYWLATGLPGGMGYYRDILSDQVNEEYVKSLVSAKQTDTLFAEIELLEEDN